MNRLRDTEWVRADAHRYALSGETQLEELAPESLADYPEKIYVENRQGALVGSVEKQLMLFLLGRGHTAMPRQILDAIRDGVIAVDGDGRIYYANEAYTAILGVPLRRVLGKYIQKIEPSALLVRALQERKSYESEKQLVSSVGKYVSLRAFPLRDGETFQGAVSIFRDLTELHQLNQEVSHMAGVVDEYSRRLQEYELSLDLNLSFHDRGFQKIVQQAATVARTDISVLLYGELGVGKNIVARYIHQCSPRCEKPMIEISCSGAPEDLLEEELLGKGDEPGKLELARNGTLFLEEISEMPSRVQSKLQRAIRRQSGARIICSSSQPLEDLVAENRFRQDLYYQLAAFTLTIPPLRERPDDIIPLANHFLNVYNGKHAKTLRLSPATYENLRAYSWPGNIRELKSHIERLVILGVDESSLPVVIPAEEPAGTEDAFTGPLEEQVRAFEAKAIRAAVDRCGGNRTRAMQELDISRRTFYRKCAELRIGAEK